MTYDISLYDKDFLKRALEINLGHWRGAPEIDTDVIASIVSSAKAFGFVESPLNPQMIEFMKQQGHTPGREFTLDKEGMRAQLVVFPASITISIVSTANFLETYNACSGLAKQWGNAHGLGYCDPQVG